jgi:hypothetical protein
MESYGLPYTWDQLKQDPEYPSANDVEEPFRWVKTPYDQSAMCVLGPLDIGSRSTHIDELEVVSQELKSWKFPFLDCCLIHSLSGVADNNFNPELASYFICVWARCIRVRSLPSYSPAWITEEYQKLDMEILQRLSNQAQLLAFVSEEQTPQLYKHIRAIEELRKKYLIILRMYLDKSF